MPNEWQVEDNTAFFDLDESHIFSIKRVENGFSMKVYSRSEEGRTLLYTRFLSDSQIGYVYVKETN